MAATATTGRKKKRSVFSLVKFCRNLLATANDEVFHDFTVPVKCQKLLL